MKKRVVITGLGAITPVGNNIGETWNSLINGVSGIAQITNFDTSELSSQIAGQIKDYKAEDHFEARETRKLDIYTQYSMIAAREAVRDAGLTPQGQDGRRIGVITGVGIGGIYTFDEECVKNHTKGPRRISPFFIPKMIGNIAAAHIAIENGFKGINFNVMSACASANHAIGTAFRSIQYGDADIIISGGTEAAVTPLAIGGFCAMRALSTRNDEPQKASRPFDAERDGFVMSEGAAFLILEELEHAKARGAKIYAELAGYGASDDAFHITAPLEDGSGSAEAVPIQPPPSGLRQISCPPDLRSQISWTRVLPV
ncbi:MAG: beta-ketoacyl-ACP synthase II [Candidatus Syntrophosphaera sp.]